MCAAGREVGGLHAGTCPPLLSSSDSCTRRPLGARFSGFGFGLFLDLHSIKDKPADGACSWLVTGMGVWDLGGSPGAGIGRKGRKAASGRLVMIVGAQGMLQAGCRAGPGRAGTPCGGTDRVRVEGLPQHGSTTALAWS